MSFQSYPKYKESGVEWLGELPEDWRVSRLGFESWVRARLGWKGLKADEYVDDGFVLLSTPNIKGRDIDFADVNFISDARYEESPEIKLRVGDVLLAKDGSTLGTANVVRCLPRAATVNSSIAVITPGPRLSGLFLYYLVQSSYITGTIQRLKGGMGVPHLFQDDINKIYVPLPPLEQQETIADFLDGEVEKIDALVAEQQRLIELLEEKRAARVSHAVTRGLNPNAPMQPSGVEWLGDVPAHWGVTKLGRKIELQRGVDITKDQQTEGEVPVVSSGGITSYHNKALIRGPGVVVGRKGTAGSLFYVESDFWPHDTTLYVRDYRGNHPKYVYYKLLALDLASFDTGSSNPTINRNLVHPTLVSWPPVREQIEIAEYLDCEGTVADSLIEQVEHAMAVLRERRSTLISAAVTGKIDVRGLADVDAEAA
ncbi:MAG: restriction endonuclease subunit S [Gemmatimonadaceae bacterium]